MPPNPFDDMTLSTQELEAQQTELALERDQLLRELEQLKTERTDLFETVVDCDESEKNVYIQKTKLSEKKNKNKKIGKRKE